MSENIVVFDTELEPLEIQTKSELELFYTGLKQAKKINSRQIDIFLEMAQAAQKNKFVDSTILSIIVEQIIYFDQATPILAKIPEIEIRKQVEKIQKGVISLRLTEDTQCIYKNEFIAASRNSVIEISGLLIRLNPRLPMTTGLEKFIFGNIDGVELFLNYLIGADLDLNFPKINFFDQTYFSFIFGQEMISELKKKMIKYYALSENFTALASAEVARFLQKTLKIKIKSPIKYHQPKTPEVKDLEEIIDQNLSYNDLFTALTNIHNIGHYNSFYGLKSPNKNALWETLKYSVKSANLQNEQTFQKFRRQMQLFQKKNIAFEKFGKAQLYLLSKKELGLVEAAHKKKYAESQHIEYAEVAELNQAIEAQDIPKIKQGLSAIEKFTKPSETFFIDEKGHNVICPHLMTKAKLISDCKIIDFLEKNTFIRNQILTQYGLIIEQNYFCRICGELLSDSRLDNISIISRQDYNSSAANQFDALYGATYKEVAYILSTYIDFLGTNLSDLTSMVRNISELINSELHIIESNLLKIKTAQKENIALTMDIYIYIYAFAAICQLIYTNPKLIQWRKGFVRGGRSSPLVVQPAHKEKSQTKSSEEISPFVVRDGDQPQPDKPDLKKKAKKTKGNINELQHIINTALYIIKQNKYIEISKSDFITKDSIKGLFLKAYRWIININYVAISHSTIDFFIQNSLIRYLIFAYNLYAYSKNKKPIPNLYPHDLPKLLQNLDNPLFKNLHLVLGRSYETIAKEIPKNIGIFDTIPTPQPWNKDKYRYDSLLMLIEYIPLVHENMINNPIYTEFYKKWEHIQVLENKINLDFIKRYLRPFISIEMHQMREPIEPSCVCEEYEITYQKVNEKQQFIGEKKVISADEIRLWLETKDYKKIADFRQLAIVKKTCKKCHDIVINTSEDIFFKYYEVSCPLGELHEFSKEDKCNKCGLTKQMWENKDPAYYKKYRAEYEKIRKLERSLLDIRLTENLPTAKKKEKSAVVWQLNITKINELIKLLKLPENEFFNLGLYEKNKYEDVKIGNLNTKDMQSDAISIKRNNHLFEYYVFIMRNYYSLKNSENTTITPKYLEGFLEKFSNQGLFKKLIPINQDKLPIYKAYKKNLSPAKLTNFLQHLISETLLTIYDIFKKNNLEPMGREYITILCKLIMNFEKKLTEFRVTRMRLKITPIDEEQPEETKTDDFDDTEDPKISEDLEYSEELVDEEPDDIFGLGDIDIDIEDAEDMDGIIKDIGDKLN